jgi:DivIVA domain-containing protein
MTSPRQYELTPEELREPAFPLALRGYDRAAVDAYVEQVQRLIAELEVTSSPESAVKDAVAQVTEETRGILEQAHEAAEEITSRSRARADDRLQEAEREAARVREHVDAHVRDLDADAEAIWNERQRLLEDVRAIADQLEAFAEEAEARFPAAAADATQTLPSGEPVMPPPQETEAFDVIAAEPPPEVDVIAADPPPELDELDGESEPELEEEPEAEPGSAA